MNEAIRAEALAYMELVAAKAATLAIALKKDSLWPGELSEGIGEIQTALRECERRARPSGGSHEALVR
jgi:hypothetical protein